MRKHIKRAFSLILSLVRKESRNVAQSREAKELISELKKGAKEGENELRKGAAKMAHHGVAFAKKAKHAASKKKNSLKKRIKRR